MPGTLQRSHPSSPQMHRILTAVAAELEPILTQRQTARLTININAGGGVRLEVARFSDIPRGET